MQTFHVKFDLADYADILPAIPEDYTEIINSEIDDPLDQVWAVQEFPDIITTEFLTREVNRVKQGVWILIKGVLMWIPPNYYQFLQYGNAGGDAPQFRLKRLKALYVKIRVRKDPRFVGTYNIKNRQDGDTTMNMSDALWEIISGELNNGMIGIQSKSLSDAKNPCWFNLKMQWNGYPSFFKNELYSHFVSGNNIEEKLQFSEPPDPNNPKDKGKNVIITYGPSTHNAFDGKNNMRRCILDEINKWQLCSSATTITNYMKFIMPGKQRKGLFDIFSSPADTNGKHNDEAYELWLNSNPDEIQSTGSTKSRILRYYSNPLEGIEGFYDKYGDADPQEIYEHIIRERNNKSKDQLMAEVRGFPLPKKGTMDADEEQLFGSTDQSNIWINVEGLKARKLELSKPLVKATKVNYCNLIWPNNIQDSGIPEVVVADKMYFDEYDARFCITDSTTQLIELSDLREPPNVVEEVIGVDPFNLRYATKKQVTGSLGAAISWKFRDIMQTGKNDYPTLAYLSRPQHGETFYEDMIKAAVFRRAKVQYENSNDKLENYFEDRFYGDWLVDSINVKPVEVNGQFKIRKGDAPSGKGATAFMNEGIGLINGHTNLPISPDKPYLLEWFNFEEIIDDLLSFNKENTQQNHFTMALIQALLGKTKLMHKKQRKKSNVNNAMLDYLFS
jgi:hypothetical protein